MGSSYINQFTQPDSIIPDPANPQAWNRYAYVLNNPINANDPSGHKCVGEPGECLKEDGKKQINSVSTKPTVKPSVNKPPREGNTGKSSFAPSCNGFEDYQGEVLSPSPAVHNSDDDAEAYTTMRGPNVPVYPWDYLIAGIDLKNYLETNWDFRSIEYGIWGLRPDVSSGLFYQPAAHGIRLSDESGVILKSLLVTNNFPEDIQRVNLNIEMLNSNSVVLAADQAQTLTPIQSGSSADLFDAPIFIPTNTYQASVAVTLQIYTPNYQGQIIHTIP